MTENREFFLIDMGKAVDSSLSLSRSLNSQISKLVPPGQDVHFLQALTHDQHLYVFLRAYDREKGGKR